VINGDSRDFIETIYSGQDIIYRFHGKKYCFQGYNKDDGFFMEIYHCEPPYEDTWSHFGSDSGQCGDAFQEAPIFDGKTFWDVEDEIEWVDA
jgi:hypothetical protein